MSWTDLASNEQFQLLLKDSPIAECLNRIDRQLVDPTTPHEKTLTLRGERAGILRVFALVEELAERESVPLEVAETEEEQNVRRLERTLGYRPIFRRSPARTAGVA